MTSMPARRRALLLGCGKYSDSSLAPLRSPRRDVEELAQALNDERGLPYAVTTMVDCESRQAQRAIEHFLSEARVSDAISLLYFSCHGVQDARGKLFFAFSDTEKSYLSSTAVPAEWVRDRIYESRSKATVILVDCCFSGAFITGMRARSSVDPNVAALVQDLPKGSGVAVLTASGETESSFEDTKSAVAGCSYFTDAVVTGISSGAADLNRDGLITVDELYEYTYDQVAKGGSPQRPRKFGMGEGTLVIAHGARLNRAVPFIRQGPEPAPVAPTDFGAAGTTAQAPSENRPESPAYGPLLRPPRRAEEVVSRPPSGDLPRPPAWRSAGRILGQAILWSTTLALGVFIAAGSLITVSEILGLSKTDQPLWTGVVAVLILGILFYAAVLLLTRRAWHGVFYLGILLGCPLMIQAIVLTFKGFALFGILSGPLWAAVLSASLFMVGRDLRGARSTKL